MKSTTTSDGEGLELRGHATENEEQPRLSRGNVTSLKDLTLRLIREVQTIAEGQMPGLDSGFDFYEEVSRFEIDLIRLALLQTGGHQRRAAKLLNLKVTTLNSKIKHYKINMADFENAFPLLMKAKLDNRQYA